MRSKLLLVLLVLQLSFLYGADGKKIAVIVGINDYDTLQPLSAAVNDSEGMYLHYNSLDYSNVFVLNDRQAKRKDLPSVPNMKRVMENIKEISLSDNIDELVFFFAGHGVQIDGNNYLCFPEADIQSKVGMLNVEAELLPWLRIVSSKLTLVFLDACREQLGVSRSVGAERGIEVVERDLKQIKKDNSLGIMVLYATRPGGFSYEKPDGSNGYFTEILLEALSSNDDNTIGDLISYVRQGLPERTIETYGKVQTPFIGGDFDLMAMFSKPEKNDSSLLYEGTGEIYVETQPSGADIYMNGIKIGKSPQFIDGINTRSVILEARKDNLYVKEDIVVKKQGLVNVNLQLKEHSGRIFLRTSESNIEVYLNDEKVDFTNNGLLHDISVGVQKVALKGDGIYWEGAVDVLLDETVQVIPNFKEVGTIDFILPEDVNAELKNINTSEKFIISGSGNLENIPIGEYKVRIRSSMYKTYTGDFIVNKGSIYNFQPNLEYTKEYENILSINHMEEMINNLTIEYESQTNSRKKLNRGGWISLASGLVFTGVSTYLWFSNEELYSQYQSETSSSKISSLRDQITLNDSLILGFGIAGSLGFTAGITLFTFGPKPKETNKKIDTYKKEIKLLKMEDL